MQLYGFISSIYKHTLKWCVYSSNHLHHGVHTDKIFFNSNFWLLLQRFELLVSKRTLLQLQRAVRSNKRCKPPQHNMNASGCKVYTTLDFIIYRYRIRAKKVLEYECTQDRGPFRHEPLNHFF